MALKTRATAYSQSAVLHFRQPWKGSLSRGSSHLTADQVRYPAKCAVTATAATTGKEKRGTPVRYPAKCAVIATAPHVPSLGCALGRIGQLRDGIPLGLQARATGIQSIGHRGLLMPDDV